MCRGFGHFGKLWKLQIFHLVNIPQSALRIPHTSKPMLHTTPALRVLWSTPGPTFVARSTPWHLSRQANIDEIFGMPAATLLMLFGAATPPDARRAQALKVDPRTDGAIDPTPHDCGTSPLVFGLKRRLR